MQGAERWGHGQDTEGEGWGRKQGKPLVHAQLLPAPLPHRSRERAQPFPTAFPKFSVIPCDRRGLS